MALDGTPNAMWDRHGEAGCLCFVHDSRWKLDLLQLGVTSAVDFL